MAYFSRMWSRFRLQSAPITNTEENAQTERYPAPQYHRTFAEMKWNLMFILNKDISTEALLHALLLIYSLPVIYGKGGDADDKGKVVRLVFLQEITDEILEIFQAKCHIRYKWILPPQNLQKGKLQWLLDSLKDKESDMIPGPVFMDFRRFKKLDFLHPYKFLPISFVTQSSKRVYPWTAIYRPFSPSVWISIAVAAVFASIFLYIFVRKESDLLGRIPDSSFLIIWNVWSTLISQGNIESYIRGISSQIMIGIWILSAVTIASAYACTLMSHLLDPQYSYVPQDFGQLAKEVSSGRYTVGTRRNSALITLLENSKEPIDKIVAEGLKKNYVNNHESTDKGMMHMMTATTDYAFIFTQREIKEVGSMIGDSKFFYSDDVIVTFMASYAVRKDFIMKKKFSDLVLRIFESGIMQKSERMRSHKLKLMNRNNDKEETVKSLGLLDIHGALILLSIGYVVSLFVLCLEMVFKNVQVNMKKRNFV